MQYRCKTVLMQHSPAWPGTPVPALRHRRRSIR